MSDVTLTPDAKIPTPLVPPAPPVPSATATPPAFVPSYELALNFNPEGLIEALSNLDRLALEVEEYVQDNEGHVVASEYDLGDVFEYVYESGTALANLLCDGGQLRGRDLVWVDDEGEQNFSRDFEEVMQKAAPWAYERLIERFPAQVAAELDKDSTIRARWGFAVPAGV